jgi:protein TonB
VVTTQSSSSAKTPQPTEQLRQTEQAIDGTAEDTVPVSEQIASLKAKLDKQREAYAQRPRVLRIKKIATKSSPEAKYLLRTIEKIEFVGTKNYPKEALEMGIQGWVRAAILLDSRGHVVQTDILDSSGKKVLDDSTIQLIYLAAPFAPFPKDIAANHDQMEIVRTFFFSIDGLRTGS